MKYKTRYIVLVYGSELFSSYCENTAYATAGHYTSIGYNQVKVIKSNKKPL